MKKKELAFIPLGGVEDINRNCYVVEYDKEILVIDLGLTIPDDDQFGIDYLIPDVDYLRKRKDQIKGIVLTHAHLDHIGAIPYLIEELGFPTIYGREFTLMFLEEKLKEFGLDKRVKMVKVDHSKDIQIGNMKVRFVPITHSIPQSSSILVKTASGNIFHTGDYKFDDEPVNEPEPDYEQLKKIGDEGVDLACFDSTNVYLSGKSKSETEIKNILEKIVKRARGRVIASTFSSLGTRLYSLMEIAKKYKRKVVVTGYSMKTMVRLLRKIGYLNVDEKLFVSDKNISGVPDENLLILTTGSQGEERSALSRMAQGEHQTIKVKSTDTIILSSSVIPGNQIAVQRLIDDLLRLGAKVIHQSFMDVHTSGHCYQDDMRTMYKLIRPRFALPVHGWPSFIHEMAYLLNKWGMKKNDIRLPETGQRFVYNTKTGRWNKDKKFPCKEIYVEGRSIGESARVVIEERRRISDHGIVIVFVKLDKSNKIIGRPSIISRGFVYVKDNNKLFQEIERQVQDTYESWRRGSTGRNKKEGVSQLQDLINKTVSKMISKKIDRYPVVVTEID
ncbi:ribonuclease J [Candidatus Dojkabacteria bacterium]|nr:ribonuclease J [Candidatus Dojkabacteria bacterium]